MRLIKLVCGVCIALTLISSLVYAKTPYTVEKNGITFVVDKENGTISDGTNVYEYGFHGDKNNYKANITYPDGSSYWWSMSGMSGSGGWSNDYDPEKYIDGDTLIEVLLEKAPRSSEHNSGNGLAAMLILILGIFNILAPRASWYLGHGWMYKDAEPSDMAVVFNRITGVIVVVIAIVLLFV